MEEYAEARILARFEKYDEFVKLQGTILQFDLNKDLTEEERRNDALAREALFRIVCHPNSSDLRCYLLSFSSLQNIKNSPIFWTHF